MTFLHVALAGPARSLRALADFYGADLGIDVTSSGADRFELAIGETGLEFIGRAGEPFYHFALLVPGNRFDAALAWASVRTQLLPDPDSGETVFDFGDWHARACYFHDPAGNIVELIAHRGVGEKTSEGVFRPAELIGLSELGLVGDPVAIAGALGDRLSLVLWDGTLEEPGRLAFVGERAHTLILSPPGRGWLPTRRPAEPHPVDALVAGPRVGEVELDGSRYRVRAVALE